MNGRAKNAERAVRNGPSPDADDSATMTSHANRRAAYAPIGRRLTVTMNATVRMNFSRGSAAWTGLSRAM